MSRSTGVDPIMVADGGVTCEYCGAAVDPDRAATTTIPATTLIRCDECGRWTAED